MAVPGVEKSFPFQAKNLDEIGLSSLLTSQREAASSLAVLFGVNRRLFFHSNDALRYD